MLPARGLAQRRTGIDAREKNISIGLLLLIVGLSASSAWAQSATVRGFVTTASDGEVLQGVNVTIDDLDGGIYGASADGNGFYLIPRFPPGRYQLRASFIGFKTYVDTLDIVAGDRLLVNIAMHTGSLALDEIAIEADRESGAARVTAGLQTVRSREIELIPSPDISGDLVSYLSTMPGVVLMGDRGGQLFIRGGEPTQNLTLLDGMDVYQPFHLLGFYSAFPAEIISRADIYAGGYGARFTGRVSAVIDVQTRNGNKRALSASAAISPFTTSGRLEGPLIKDRVSMLGVVRYSLLDQIASRYVNAPLPYTFSDVFGKMHMLLGKNQQLSFTALHTYDSGTLIPEEDFFERNDQIGWRNTALGLRYLVAPQTLSVLGEFLVSYSRLQSTFGPGEIPNRTADLETVNIALNMTNYTRHSEVNWGFFFRTPTSASQLDGLFQNLQTRREVSSNAGFYLEPEMYLGKGLFVRPGVSVQVYGVSGGVIEPRVRLRWQRGVHHWSAAAGLYQQYLIGLSDRRDATNIFTAWVETPFDEGTSAVHMLLGYRVEPLPWLEISMEGFYKRMERLFIGEWTPFPSFTTRLQQADGETVGFDIRLEVRRPWFYGFINYGYASTLYEINPASPALVDPGKFRPPHDRRHQINLLASTSIYGFDVNVRWQFGSGLPYTPVEGFDGFILMDGVVDVREVRGLPRVIYQSIPYQAQLPAYHRLDVTVDRTFRASGGVDVTAQVGVLNAYDRANLFTLDLLTAQRTDQLPLVPIVGLKVEF